MNESPEILCRHCNVRMTRVITGGGGFKIDGAFHSMSKGVTKKADLQDHISEIKQVGKDDAQAGRDMSMPRSKD
jgi:predicted nucleic acid-binding Zn ribbon protein